MLTREREDHLYTQYVLTIINDGTWYRKAKPWMDEGRIAGFIEVTHDQMTTIRRALKDTALSDHQRAFIYMACWSHYGYTVDGLINGCPYRDLKKAMVELQGQSAPAIPTPTTTPEPEVQPVNNTTHAVAFETRHYVYGMDVANMTSGQLIEAIKKLEVEIADLKGVKAKSEHIKKRIAELDGMLAKVVEVLDTK